MSAANRSRQSGFTMVEVAITMLVLSMLALVVERTIAAASNGERQFEAIRRATERGQVVSYEILRDVESAARLFDGDARGVAYLEALELGGLPPAPGARLPVFESLRPLGRDLPGDPRTGNILLLARAVDPAACIASLKKSKRKNRRFIDMVRFVCVYPHQTARRVVVEDDRGDAVDLVIWRSVRFPDAAQLRAIAKDEDRQAVIQDLVARFGCELAWDASAPLDRAFFPLDAAGTISDVPLRSPRIEEDLDVTSRGRLAYVNCQLAPTLPLDYNRRAVFTVDEPDGWAPGGFEVKLNGASGGRIVWIHVVVEAQGGRGRVGVHASTVRGSVNDV